MMVDFQFLSFYCFCFICVDTILLGIYIYEYFIVNLKIFFYHILEWRYHSKEMVFFSMVFIISTLI